MSIDRVKIYPFLAIGMVLLAILACNRPGSVPSQPGEPTPIPAGQTEPATAVVEPTLPVVTPAQPATTLTIPAPTAQPAEPTAQPGPLCTVQTELNLRSGPGTAYRPPIRALPAGTELVPLGFNPQGVPGGPWVQVRDVARNEIGWVSAGQQFVACNLDLSGLPAVAVAPPPPPPPPNVTDSVPDGSCPEGWVCELDFSNVYLLRMRVFDSLSGETSDGAGIEQVVFTVVDQDGRQVYQRTEVMAAYCIFAGGEPDCNPWTIEDFVYKWTPGGEAVQSGAYQIIVDITGADGSTTGHWEIDVELSFP